MTYSFTVTARRKGWPVVELAPLEPLKVLRRDVSLFSECVTIAFDRPLITEQSINETRRVLEFLKWEVVSIQEFRDIPTLEFPTAVGAIVDSETTGLFPFMDQLIEISIILFRFDTASG